MSFKKWLPPLELCCEEVSNISIIIGSNCAMHFKSDCPKHGEKGVHSPFSKSVMGYSVIVSPKITETKQRTYQPRIYHEQLD